MPDDLDSLFRLHHHALQRYAREGLRDRSWAADIVQDAFLRYAAASQGAGAARPIGNPAGFLWQVVRNLVRDQQRQRRRRGTAIALQDLPDGIADPRPSAEQALGHRQDFATLCAALEELPRDCRQALLLSRIEGLTHPEIAARLGVSTSMVTKHIVRGIRHCTRRLSEA